MSRDGVRLVWALLCAYLAAASAICFFGLAGIVRSKPSFARIYRVYIIGDFVFGPLFAAIGSFAQRFALIMFASCCHAASGLY
ncbi:hypothetical protein M405DRAFT_834893 [Rhizopogon salebrosus TDB-379]|nr:hypothetical protein M405DRAFT_834893 [Rhizopogon salebrosus TDB-379]